MCGFSSCPTADSNVQIGSTSATVEQKQESGQKPLSNEALAHFAQSNMTDI